MRKTILSLMIAATTLIPASVAARQVDGDSDQLTVRVSFADLNLDSPGGRASLDRRLSRAVDLVCGTPRTANFDEAATINACRKIAEASASSQRQVAVAEAQRHSSIQLASGAR